MKGAGLLVVAGLVGYFTTQFLPQAPGLESTVTFVGTVAAIGGGALGIRGALFSNRALLVSVVAFIALFILSVSRYRSVIFGEPGEVAAIWLYVWTALMFVPIGYLIEVAGLKLTAGDEAPG